MLTLLSKHPYLLNLLWVLALGFPLPGSADMRTLQDAIPLNAGLAANGTLPERAEIVHTFTTTTPQMLRIQAVGKGIGSLTYYDAQGHAGNTVAGYSPLRLDQLALPAGTHYVQLTGQGNYLIKVITLGKVPEGTSLLVLPAPPPTQHTVTTDLAPETPIPPTTCLGESEAESAPTAPLTLPFCFSGSLGAEDTTDTYTLAVSEANANQSIQLDIDFPQNRLVVVTLADQSGETLQTRILSTTDGESDQLRLPGLVLAPGVYTLTLKSSDDARFAGQLTLHPKPLAHQEQEPNDYLHNASSFGSKPEMVGAWEGEETDMFWFETKGKAQLWRIEVAGTGAETLSYYNAAGKVMASRSKTLPDRIQINNLLLLPGRNVLGVAGNNSDYVVRVTPLGPPDETDPSRPLGKIEQEPNDDETQAEPLRFNEVRTGLLAEADDWDVYQFTLFSTEEVMITATPGADGEISRMKLDNIAEATSEPGKPASLPLTLPPGDHYLSLKADPASNTYYQVLLTRSDPILSEALKLSITSATPVLAAYLNQGQTLQAQLAITNTSDQAQKVEWAVTASHPDWQVLPLAQSIDLPAHSQQNIPLTIQVMADAWDDQPVRLTVLATSTTATAKTHIDFNAQCGAQPVNPAYHWLLPPALLGGLNVAWVGLGAKPVDTASQSDAEKLIDGITAVDSAWRTQPSGVATFELVSTVALAGVVLDPNGSSRPEEQLKNFIVSVSTDGEHFATALQASLSGTSREQGFVFPSPISARYLRITALDNQAGADGTIQLGELKAIATPGTVLDKEGLNLADPKVGGYLVNSNPLQADAYQLLSTDQQQKPDIRLDTTQDQANWVVGFQHNRAAKISQFEWDTHTVTDGDKRLDRLNVAVSLESPTGPWQPLGEWVLAQNWQLPTPVWARYVQFTAPHLKPEETYRLAATLRIREQTVDTHYRSILGEWGKHNRQATYEHMNPLLSMPPPPMYDQNNQPEQAQPLKAGGEVKGAVQIQQDVDWYTIVVAPDQTSVTITLTGRAEATLYDSQQRRVELNHTQSAHSLELSADLMPGKYILRVEEPPHSVVLTWDNSTSMTDYTNTMYRAMARFSSQVRQGGTEAIQLLPFSDQPLLKDWSDDPINLMTALNTYNRQAASSDVEATLVTAGKALQQRRGSHTILLMTDADSTSYESTPALWDILNTLHPTFYTLEANITGQPYPQDLMQSWADVAGGHYSLTSTNADFAIGFNRASCQLRRAIGYQLTYRAKAAEPPGDGFIKVEASPVDAPLPVAAQTRGAVEIILDASGSMEQKIAGQSRITIAKRVLLDITQQVLPKGSPFALRVFGNRTAQSCRTDLEIPLSPLDPAAVSKFIKPLHPKLKAGTPIANSILQAAQDLQGSEQATLILLTDGVESCGGNVEAAIQQLQAQGIDVKLTIIGLGVNEEAIKTQFRQWATLGKGQYLEAGNGAELKAVLTQAVKQGFTVFTPDGKTVTQGKIGQAVNVPSGRYRVQLDNGALFDSVSVKTAETTTLTTSTTP